MMKDLSKVTFLPASFDKRFYRDVSSQINATGEVTDRQGALIPTLHYRYRRQHGKPTPNYDPDADPMAHRSDTAKKAAEEEALKRWNEASGRSQP